MKSPFASYSTAVLFSLGLHGLLVALLVVGWTPEHKPTVVKPRYIEAKLLQMEPKATPKPKQKPKVAQPKPVDSSAAQRKAEQQRKEAQRQKELARKKELARQEAEKKRKAEAARQEKLKREQAEKRRQEEEARKRKQKEEELARALAAEEEFFDTLDDQEAIGSYSDYIRNRIESNWSRPPSARRDMQVELEIQLVPTGRVVSVSVVKSSGSAAFDRSAEQAVHKVGQFDKLRGMESRLFESNFRRFRMVFSPEDLRL